MGRLVSARGGMCLWASGGVQRLAGHGVGGERWLHFKSLRDAIVHVLCDPTLKKKHADLNTLLLNLV